MTARVGDHFGPYLLLHKIAQGGMGEVFLARKEGAEGFSRNVVVKRLLSHLAERADFLEMFFAEARLSSRLHHERIVQVSDAGRIGDEFYLEMEFVAGVDLKGLLERCDERGQPLPLAVTCELIAQAAEGLAYAHSASDHDGAPLNLVHRDINPANLLVSWQGEIKIIDLGIAKSELHHGKTETGMLKGKFLYMSPEQSEGRQVSGSTDLFSLGIVLYEALLGRHPFDRGALARTLAAIQEDPLPPFIDPHTFPVEELLNKALAKAPSQRYLDGDEFAQALREQIPNLPEHPPLYELMSEMFADEQEFLTQVLGKEDPQELKRLDRLTHPPIDGLPTIAAGMDKPEGWTDFWQKNEPGAVDPLELTGELRVPQASPSTGTLFIQRALSRSKRLWALVALLAFLVMFWGLSLPLPETTAEPSPEPSPVPRVLVAQKTKSILADVGAPTAPSTPDTGPAKAPKPTPKLERLRVSSKRLTISGLEGSARRGQFNAKGGGLSVSASWRRREDGSVAVSVQARPWAIVYEGDGPALGRSPPARHLRLPKGGAGSLRFRHPSLGEFRLSLRLSEP
jgi:serine/threonine protein kinase